MYIKFIHDSPGVLCNKSHAMLATLLPIGFMVYNEVLGTRGWFRGDYTYSNSYSALYHMWPRNVWAKTFKIVMHLPTALTCYLQSPDFNSLDYYIWNVFDKETNLVSHSTKDSLKVAIIGRIWMKTMRSDQNDKHQIFVWKALFVGLWTYHHPLFLNTYICVSTIIGRLVS